MTSARWGHVLHLLWKLVGSHSKQQEIHLRFFSCLYHPMKQVRAAETVTLMV